VTPDSDVQKALDVARALIRAGVPVFAAEPCTEGCPRSTVINKKTRERKPHAGGPGKYHLPKHWEQTVPSERWLDPEQHPQGWRPGYALAAVGGHVADFLDADPRNGGEESLRQLHERDIFPLTFGQQKTPSDGDHWVIAATGLRKATGETGGFLPGLDLQAGAPDGHGRGFVWIAPTVRRSKTDGELRAYEWITEPDFESLAAAVAEDDTGTEGIISLVTENRAKRTEPRPRESAPVAASSPDDPFLSPSQIAGGFGNERAFTLAEAQEFVRAPLIALQLAKVGEIEESANVAATTLSHFVPAFWSVDEAFALLESMLAHTAYDPNGPSDWTADKFIAVLDGSRPPADPWTATRRPEPPAAPLVAVEAAPGEEHLTTVQRLRNRLVSMRELSERATPDPLVHGLLNLNTESWLIGAPGSLKSFIALDIAGHVALGQDWQGHSVVQRPVLYLAAEGEGGMVLRTRAYIRVHGEVEGVTFLPYPVQVKSNDGQWAALVEIAAELKPGLIVLDTQARISVGLEENSATDMGVLIAAVGALKRATGACVLVVHHTGRDGGNARGSSALDGAQDTELKVTRPDNPAGRASLVCKITQDKQKDMSEGDGRGIELIMQAVDLGIDPKTGKPISSLVVNPQIDAADKAMRELEGFSVTETESFKGRKPEGWTATVEGVPSNATVKRRILQVLADHAHERGLTAAQARAAVIARWYEKGKAPDHDSWIDSWNTITSLPMACNLGGERWALDQVEINGLRAADPFA